MFYGSFLFIDVFLDNLPPFGIEVDRMDHSRKQRTAGTIRKWRTSRVSELVLGVIRTVVLVAALMLVVGTVIEYGFMLTDEQRGEVKAFYLYTWGVFIIDRLLHVILKPGYVRKSASGMELVMNILLILSVLPIIVPSLRFLSAIFFNGPVLLLSILELSYFLTHILGKRTNPSAVMAISFLVIILIGSLLLIMPKCTIPEVNLSWIDSLFTATSAVCVTGLIPIDVASTFTFSGQLIIICLIQIGGLGVMTLTSFFALFFMGEISVNNSMVVKDLISSESLSSIWSTLKHIIVLTFSLEAAGAVLIWISIHNTLGLALDDEFFFAVFHSVSAFCNAGFSNFAQGLGNPLILNDNYLIFWVIALLVICGGIGYPVLMEVKNVISGRIRKVSSFGINTRIVLLTTTILLALGTALLAIFEWNSSFAGRSTFWKLTQAFFNSASPRTAGFISLDLTGFCTQSVLVYMFLMWVGGASQSTAGGIKVNTLAVAVLNILAVMRGQSRVEIHNRELTRNSVHRANATITLSIFVLAIAILLTSIVDPNLSLKAVAFECISALGTVGSSLNATPLLTTAGKVIIILLMFFGRVGVLTIAASFVRPKGDPEYRLPKAEIM